MAPPGFNAHQGFASTREYREIKSYPYIIGASTFFPARISHAPSYLPENHGQILTAARSDSQRSARYLPSASLPDFFPYLCRLPQERSPAQPGGEEVGGARGGAGGTRTRCAPTEPTRRPRPCIGAGLTRFPTWLVGNGHTTPTRGMSTLRYPLGLVSSTSQHSATTTPSRRPVPCPHP